MVMKKGGKKIYLAILWSFLGNIKFFFFFVDFLITQRGYNPVPCPLPYWSYISQSIFLFYIAHRPTNQPTNFSVASNPVLIIMDINTFIMIIVSLYWMVIYLYRWTKNYFPFSCSKSIPSIYVLSLFGVWDNVHSWHQNFDNK